MFEGFRVVDLTHPISERVPSWSGSCGFQLELKRNYEQDFCVQKMHMHAGVGTHMDAPSHCFREGRSIEKLHLRELMVPVCVMDVSDRADANYQVSLSDLQAYEKAHGVHWEGSLVIVHTGWSRFWGEGKSYRNEDAQGVMHFPSVGAEAAEYLVEKGIVGLGVDTLSPDSPGSGFPVHRIVLGADKYIIENIAHVDQLPAYGAHVLALPLHVEEAAEAPIRLVGLISAHQES